MTYHIHQVSLIFVHSLKAANRVSFALPRRRLCSQGMHLHTRYKKINILKNTQPSIKVELKNI